MGRPLAPLSIESGEREQLLAWSRRPKTAQALAMRARIVLLASDGDRDGSDARDRQFSHRRQVGDNQADRR